MLRSKAVVAFAARTLRHYGTTSRLGHTSVFVQSGLKIRELPMVVKKVNDVLQIQAGCNSESMLQKDDGGGKKAEAPSSRDCDFVITVPEKMNKETAEIIDGFNRTFTANGIFRLLETIPAEDVTPSVAIHALKRIIILDNNMARRNPNYLQNLQEENQSVMLGRNHGELNKHGETFLRFAFINMLLDIVYRSRDPKAILEGLEIVSWDNFPDENGQTLGYKERMYEETLVLVTEGLFNLVEICEAVAILSKFYENDKKRCFEMTDKLWAGILDKAPKQLNAETMAHAFGTLPHLKTSRDVVLKMLDAKVGDFWQEYKTRDILDMLRVLTELGQVNGSGARSTLPVISQWLAVNVQNLSEAELLAVVVCMNKLEFVNDKFVETLEKYMKIRGVHIKEKDLVGAIADYCHDFRIRSKPILEGAGEFFIENGMSLSTPQVNSITRIFGELDFHPPNGFRFWDLVEHVLEHRFVEFPPRDIINLLLTFVFIERFPSNFVRKIFNPYFMDRLHSQTEADIFHSRDQLKLFDVSMKLECESYGGPFLPRESGYRKIQQDPPRVRQLANDLMATLGEIVGDVKRIENSVVLSSLPLNKLYIADIVIYPSVTASLMRVGLQSSINNQTVLVLIHPEEHYDRSQQHLIGQQAMRVRQMKKMGFRVMEINYSVARKLLVMPPKLKEYLAKEYYKAIKG